MKIQYDQVPSGEWRAIDTNEYDGECDSNGWWSASLVGYGATREAALADLLAEIEDRAKERIAELQYEAGMNRSLYENAKKRIEVLEAALRDIRAILDQFQSSPPKASI
jgi:hypothetical protein